VAVFGFYLTINGLRCSSFTFKVLTHQHLNM